MQVTVEIADFMELAMKLPEEEIIARLHVAFW